MWLERGWVRDEDAVPQPHSVRLPEQVDSRDPGPALAPWPRHAAPPARGSTRRHYQLLDTGFELRASDEVARRVHPTLAHLETAGPETPDALFEVVRRGGEWILSENGVEAERCDTPEGLAPMVKGELWRVAVNRQRFFMEIHAGVVERYGRCLLLPGAPGSGKTTLTAALVAAGFTLFSDETALLEETDLDARAVPLSLTIKSGAVGLLAPAFPHLPELPEHARQDGRTVRYLNPPRGSLPPSTRQVAPVGALVFPHVGSVSRLERLPKIEGLRRLLAECVVLPELLNVEKVRALVGWMRRVDCYDLSSGPLPEAIAAIEAVASEWAAGAD